MSRSGKASLSELMGAVGSQHGHNLELRHLPQILGDAMPEMPRNALGRHRLITALQQRFGDNWRALPGVAGLVDQFDREADFEDHLDKIRAVKVSGMKRSK